MSSAFSESFERSLQKIWQLAQTRGHGYMTLEHIMLAVLDEPSTQDLFRKQEISPADVQDELLDHIERYKPQTENTSQKVEETRGVSRVQTRAKMIFDIPTGIHVLEMLFEERHSHVIKVLRKYGIDRTQVSEFRVQLDRARFSTQARQEESRPQRRLRESTPETSRKENATQRYVTDLNKQVRKGEVDALIGRQEEMDRIIQTLGRRRKNNVVLVGEAGVGKTALAEGLAWKIEQQEVPASLSSTTVLSLNVGSLVAGTRFRGDFEERMKNLLQSIRQWPNTILFIDEIHTLVGAGSASGMVMDAADLLKPLLAAGELHCIGATTHREFRQIFEKDAALARRFQRIDVQEPPVDEARRILEGLKGAYETHHRVHYSEEAMHSMVDLSIKYMHDRRLPDKAIDLMDEAGSFCRMHQTGEEIEVGVRDVERIVAMLTRIPESDISAAGMRSLINIDKKLKSAIFGQDDAIDQLTQALKLARADLKPAQRPVGTFLFSGPTGVGKTEVCRQLAEAMGVELLRFDMSEYMERHSVARLIGAPPGYIGYDEGGLLTEAVVKHPYAVLLLDEAEKAHPDIMSVLLQVMDYGKLTDSNGREVDFRNLVLVLTCNVGAMEYSREPMGFTSAPTSADVTQAVEKAFAVEFRNRLDAIVPFAPLDEDSILSVVDRLLNELQHSLKEHEIQLKVNKRARRWLAAKGFDPAMGARPMERIVREYIRLPLAEEMLSGSFHGGGVFRVTANRLGLHLKVETALPEVLH